MCAPEGIQVCITCPRFVTLHAKRRGGAHPLLCRDCRRKRRTPITPAGERLGRYRVQRVNGELVTTLLGAA